MPFWTKKVFLKILPKFLLMRTADFNFKMVSASKLDRCAWNDDRDGSFVKERLMGKFLESGENDLELQILLITRALEQKQAAKMSCRRGRRSDNLKINKKLWLNNMVEKTFHSVAEFKLFLEKRNATKTLDIMVDNIKKEVKERKVV